MMPPKHEPMQVKKTMALPRLFLSFILVAISFSATMAQSPFFHLLEKDADLYADVVKREQILDLVRACTYDSVLGKGTQRHVVFPLGIMMNAVGMKWRAMDAVKQKYVGTHSRRFKMFYGIGKEKDYNFFLTPHIQPYVQMMAHAFDTAQTWRKSDKGYRLDSARWPCPPELQYKGECLSVECEGTPHPDYMQALDSLLLPTDKDKHGFDHPNFHGEFPSIGLYGAFCLDCNHNCRPEIHPIDWMWWLDIDSARAEVPATRTWFVGLLRDCSNRFDDWSASPLSGTLSIPFLVKAGRRVHISVDHLLMDEAVPGNYEGVPGSAAYRKNGDEPLLMTQMYSHLRGRAPEFTFTINGQPVDLNNRPSDNGVFTAIEFVEEENGYIRGYVHLFASVKNVFAGRVQVQSR